MCGSPQRQCEQHKAQDRLFGCHHINRAETRQLYDVNVCVGLHVRLSSYLGHCHQAVPAPVIRYKGQWQWQAGHFARAACGAHGNAIQMLETIACDIA